MQNLKTLFFRSGQVYACPLTLLWNQPDRSVRGRTLHKRKAPDLPVEETGYIPNGYGHDFYPRSAGRFFELARGSDAVPYLPERNLSSVTINYVKRCRMSVDVSPGSQLIL